MNKIIKIAVDAMGGDGSPKKIVDGIVHHYQKNKQTYYKIFGDQNKISGLVDKNLPTDSFEIIHTTDLVMGTDSPLEGAKRGRKTSMWLAVQSVKEKKSDIVISAGNTGALLVISKLNLKMIENIDKPALSALWPNKKGMSVVLDLGANIDCSPKNLIDFSIMGSSLFKSLYPNENSKVALLNIGSEEIKGTEMHKKAFSKLRELSSDNNFLFDGYIEGNELMNGDTNVIVTDGFTGNIALKTAEGTAKFIVDNLKSSLSENFFSKFSTLFSYFSLKRFKTKIDPRKYNGAIFLGLNGPVVKSHGGIDSLDFYYSIDLCYRIIKGDLMGQIRNNLNHLNNDKQ